MVGVGQAVKARREPRHGGQARGSMRAPDEGRGTLEDRDRVSSLGRGERFVVDGVRETVRDRVHPERGAARACGVVVGRGVSVWFRVVCGIGRGRGGLGRL